MKRVTGFITDVMIRYSNSMESCLEDIGECVSEITEYMIKGIKCLLVGLAVVFGYIFLAVTMPVWYLPYKHFKRKQKE